ncbi:DNA polymerase-3 subunit beta [Azospirillum agricola]|uniref:DNA polymerase III subunit beta n=1 Tax=Azospirillum agricola TaxID=1720247 RepID=UPI001AEACF22|nr:DNA polymerase III subunit beta [Azospirillum agricola]MBP2232507.1 DNA polymerase-3 subunit beta [Azospirillum agricola]
MNATVKERPRADHGTVSNLMPSVTLDAQALRKAVEAVAPAMDLRSANPLLAHIAFVVEAEGGVTVRATNEDSSLDVTCDVRSAEGAVPFAAAISGRTLTKLLASVGPSPITMSLTTNGVVLQCGDLSGRIPVLPIADFPAVIHSVCDRPFEMPAGDLVQLLETVQHAISTEETRYYLNGVHIHRRDGKLVAAATDGHRMAIASLATPVDGTHPDLDAGVILHRKAVKHLLRLLAVLPDTVAVVVRLSSDQPANGRRIGGRPRMAFSWSHGDMQVRVDCGLIDGTFPDYIKVIPQTFTRQCVVYRSFLRRAAHTLLSVLGEVRDRPDGKPWLKLLFVLDKTCLRLSGSSEEHGDLTTRVTVASQDAVETGFNARYVVECMDAFECDAVAVKFNDAREPFVLEAAEDGRVTQGRERVSLLQVLMPARV